MYQSPGTKYFESIGIGFRGMSGALITNTNSSNVLGIFIRKVNNLGTNQNDSTLDTEMIGVSRGFIMPSNIIQDNILSKKNIQIFPDDSGYFVV